MQSARRQAEPSVRAHLGQFRRKVLPAACSSPSADRRFRRKAMCQAPMSQVARHAVYTAECAEIMASQKSQGPLSSGQ